MHGVTSMGEFPREDPRRQLRSSHHIGIEGAVLDENGARHAFLTSLSWLGSSGGAILGDSLRDVWIGCPLPSMEPSPFLRLIPALATPLLHFSIQYTPRSEDGMAAGDCPQAPHEREAWRQPMRGIDEDTVVFGLPVKAKRKLESFPESAIKDGGVAPDQYFLGPAKRLHGRERTHATTAPWSSSRPAG